MGERAEVCLPDDLRNSGAECNPGASAEGHPVGVERVPDHLQREPVVDHVEVSGEVLGTQVLHDEIDRPFSPQRHAVGGLDHFVESGPDGCVLHTGNGVGGGVQFGEQLGTLELLGERHGELALEEIGCAGQYRERGGKTVEGAAVTRRGHSHPPIDDVGASEFVDVVAGDGRALGVADDVDFRGSGLRENAIHELPEL